MSFNFFAFNSRFFWEDVYNYNDWTIQLNVRTLKYRLVDPLGVKREAGDFELCKNTLLKYIEICELTELKENTVIILHGFGKTSSSVKLLAKNLKEINANIISLSYATLQRGVAFHANILAQMLQNTDIKGKLYIINVGSSCLITRKFIADSGNYRRYNIDRILDINPKNSGSDLAELFVDKKFINFILGPMLKDITTTVAVKYKKLPKEIDHGIIFVTSPFMKIIKRLFARFESFPFSTPPSERSYAEKIQEFDADTCFVLNDKDLFKYCKNFITTGNFAQDFQPFSHIKGRVVRRVRNTGKNLTNKAE